MPGMFGPYRIGLGGLNVYLFIPNNTQYSILNILTPSYPKWKIEFVYHLPEFWTVMNWCTTMPSLLHCVGLGLSRWLVISCVLGGSWLSGWIEGKVKLKYEGVGEVVWQAENGNVIWCHVLLNLWKPSPQAESFSKVRLQKTWSAFHSTVSSWISIRCNSTQLKLFRY